MTYYYCNDCKTFQPADMIKEIEESHGETFRICGNCGGDDMENVNQCTCGQLKKEADDYCKFCKKALLESASEAVREFATIMEKPLWEAKEELLRTLEEEYE